jgi:hypothetical protein
MSGNAPTPTPPAPSNGPDGAQGGGDSNAAGTPQPPAQPTPQGDPAPPAPSQPATPEPSEQPDQGQQGLEAASRDDLLAEIRTLRRENAKRRTTTQEATQTAAEQAKSELAQQIGKALGLVEDGEATPDASKLTEQLTAQTQAAKQAQLELAVYKAASMHGADADALLDSRSFLEKVADLDPTNTDELNAAIKDVVENNPRLQAGQVPPKRSGNQLNKQQTNEPVAQTPEELANLVPRGY